ncbi:transcriptional repressor NF-X1 [Capsaspora owczarzaki ATCC 30864]|uniref:Transcriptional repressor NF-X1 n=1 Tax=Capsaspora owczarzaki (strain ATCC 30864) TaxID=595528 RepID=A0A0D2UM40_CAPO3|nr:transcriptional repressor NF-X1 [Capsaspora owczarzaki ATCC 30864]KJE96131.1 transcriptional repressor NF-X1 [Capsaspora owczarzaki ATCC 30864]|eukprot:XP_004345247.2 transcriptional repressor NF-X1 [Capsaspora owczarzaki ATCC 30864]
MLDPTAAPFEPSSSSSSSVSLGRQSPSAANHSSTSATSTSTTGSSSSSSSAQQQQRRGPRQPRQPRASQAIASSDAAAPSDADGTGTNARSAGTNTQAAARPQQQQRPRKTTTTGAPQPMSSSGFVSQPDQSSVPDAAVGSDNASQQASSQAPASSAGRDRTRDRDRRRGSPKPNANVNAQANAPSSTTTEDGSTSTPADSDMVNAAAAPTSRQQQSRNTNSRQRNPRRDISEVSAEHQPPVTSSESIAAPTPQRVKERGQSRKTLASQSPGAQGDAPASSSGRNRRSNTSSPAAQQPHSTNSNTNNNNLPSTEDSTTATTTTESQTAPRINTPRSAAGRRIPKNVTELTADLISQLRDNSYECMVCCDRITRKQPVYSCSNCYAVFHIACLKKWASSAASTSSSGGSNANAAGWRCPGCQHVSERDQLTYTCFCAKVRNPDWNPHHTPHSCGEVCSKSRRGTSCPHPCPLLCHPGPCSPCTVMLTKKCHCGKSSLRVRCGDPTASLACEQTCDRFQSCGRHTCQQRCHDGPCPPCDHSETQRCYCGAHTRIVACGTGEPDFAQRLRTPSEGAPSEANVIDGPAFYSCASVCGSLLDCKQHECRRTCHAGPCADCPLTPARVTTCPCTKTPIDVLQQKQSGGATARRSCLDPVPVCGKTCGKQLPCARFDTTGKGSHRCTLPCHEGPCSPCPSSVRMVCRCKMSDRTVPCAELAAFGREQRHIALASGEITAEQAESMDAEDADHERLGETLTQLAFRCDRVCRALRHCKRHNCGIRCCTTGERKNAPDASGVHICKLVCGKKLQCGLHKCEEVCHPGHCAPCMQSTFDEVACECGKTVLFPPIRCGTSLPPCPYPCTREHGCSHPVLHTCHRDVKCPPCVTLTPKMCMGGHELRKSVPCHIQDVSCGRACERTLSCGQHTCQLTCHKDACQQFDTPLQPDELRACTRPCGRPRLMCEHACATPCHPGQPCPETPCRELVRITCKCNTRQQMVPCGLGAGVPGSMEATRGMSLVDFALAQRSLKQPDQQAIPLRVRSHEQVLECDGECALVERNRRLAEALGIEHANLTSVPILPGTNSSSHELGAALSGEAANTNGLTMDAASYYQAGSAAPQQTRPAGVSGGAVSYSAFLFDAAKKTPAFITSLEETLHQFIMRDTATRSRSLQVLNAHFRRVVHELCEHYRVKTFSLDEEPNRNPVLTKTPLSHVPAILLSEAARAYNPDTMGPITGDVWIRFGGGAGAGAAPQISLRTDSFGSFAVRAPMATFPVQQQQQQQSPPVTSTGSSDVWNSGGGWDDSPAASTPVAATSASSSEAPASPAVTAAPAESTDSAAAPEDWMARTE